MPPQIEFVWDDDRTHPIVYCIPVQLPTQSGSSQPLVEKTKFPSRLIRNWKAQRGTRWK